MFTSQHRLGLRLICYCTTPIKQILDLWPAIPIVVENTYHINGNFDNIIAALQQHDRVCEIALSLQGRHFEEVSQIMQNHFPLLNRLSLKVCGGFRLSLPSTFLGGSAPRLRVLYLNACCDPELPRFLSSTNNLVNLRLEQGMGTDCVSPEALVAALSVAPRLKTLDLQFLSATRHSNLGNTPPPSSGRIVSSTLLELNLKVPCDYLEDLLSRISTPSLERTYIEFFEQPEPGFDVSQLSQFLRRVELRDLLEEAMVGTNGCCIRFSLARAGAPPWSAWLYFKLPFLSRLGLPQMVQICQKMTPLLSSVRTLNFYMSDRPWRDDENGARWVDLLRMFNGVEKLRPSPTATYALRFDSPEIAIDVLPKLRELGFNGVGYGWEHEPKEVVTSFTHARNLAGLPAIEVHLPNFPD